MSTADTEDHLTSKMIFVSMLKSPLKWDIKTIAARRLPFQNASHHRRRNKKTPRWARNSALSWPTHFPSVLITIGAAGRLKHRRNNTKTTKWQIINWIAFGTGKGEWKEKTNNKRISHQEAQLIKAHQMFLRSQKTFRDFLHSYMGAVHKLRVGRFF